MAGPALKIVLRPKGKAPMGEASEPDLGGYGDGAADDDEDEDVDGAAKREALGKLAEALGLKVRDEGAALEALETLIYHCTEG